MGHPVNQYFSRRLPTLQSGTQEILYTNMIHHILNIVVLRYQTPHPTHSPIRKEKKSKPPSIKKKYISQMRYLIRNFKLLP